MECGSIQFLTGMGKELFLKNVRRGRCLMSTGMALCSKDGSLGQYPESMILCPKDDLRGLCLKNMDKVQSLKNDLPEQFPTNMGTALSL